MIKWEDIDLKGKTSGQHKLKCPACIDRRSNKRDRSLSVNITEGVARCHYCEEISIRDTEEEKEYKLPPQNWKNYTTLSEKVVKWFESRGISQATVINCGITEEKYFQPAIGKEVQNVVYNYFEGEKVVNKKYRGPGKKFTQSGGTKNIFYGINDVIGQTEAYVVEGEMDKLALYEIGIKNAISVPNGANDNDDVWENSKKYLDGIEKFYIATDCDVKGNELSDKVSQRLGKWRCLRVTFKNKDANDDLIEGREVLEESVKNAKRYPVSGTFTAKDLSNEIFALYDSGLPQTIYPKHPSFGRLKDIYSTMRGHLIVPTGIPSHGKSNYVEWEVMNLVNDWNLKASFFSPEHLPMELHHSTFISKYWAKPFFPNKKFPGLRVTKEEIQTYMDWADQRLYLTSPDKDEFPTWDWLFDKFKEQMFSYGVDIFVIDAFNKVSFSKPGNRLEQIGEVLTKLTMFAQLHNVIIYLIAHPTKMRKNEQGIYDCPTLYDVSGSADFRNQTHDGFAIYRHFDKVDPESGVVSEYGYTEFVNLKTKMNFQGEIGGKVEFEYHEPSGRFFERGTGANTAPLHDFYKEADKVPAEEKKLPQMKPKKDLWDVYDEIEEDNSDVPF